MRRIVNMTLFRMEKTGDGSTMNALARSPQTKKRSKQMLDVHNSRGFAAAWLLMILVGADIANGQWDPPANFYSSATGSGSTLQNQIRAIMTAGHIQRTYGDYRFSASISDRDPNNSSRILLVYDRSSVSGNWDSGVTWNREHVWPQSRQPGTVTNGSQGNLGDPHALRPSIPDINADRASMPFGFEDTTGNFGDLGTYWYPGDVCRGDIARSLLYSETRWSSLGLSLTNNFPNGNQMGDLSSVIAWHYLDPPDEFERRRNHVIFSSASNPSYFTNNRNAYIDRPEFVWSIYMDQQNDSMIEIDGGSNIGPGMTTLAIDFGAALVGASVPATQNVTLDKFGNDGTYYSLQASGDAVVDLQQTERLAFRSDGTDSVTFDVSLDYNPDIPGVKTGFVTVDNLDITTQGGLGRGANDGDDFIIPQLTILEHSNASFDSTVDQDDFFIDLGQVDVGSTIQTNIPIYNLASASGIELTAGLDLDSVQSNNDSLSIDGPMFSDLDAGESAFITINGSDTSTIGTFATVFTIGLSDVDLPGAINQVMSLIATFEVVDTGFILGDVNGDGTVNLLDVGPFVDLIGDGGFVLEADINEDGVVNLLDVGPFVDLLSGG